MNWIKTFCDTSHISTFHARTYNGWEVENDNRKNVSDMMAEVSRDQNGGTCMVSNLTLKSDFEIG